MNDPLGTSKGAVAEPRFVRQLTPVDGCLPGAQLRSNAHSGAQQRSAAHNAGQLNEQSHEIISHAAKPNPPRPPSAGGAGGCSFSKKMDYNIPMSPPVSRKFTLSDLRAARESGRKIVMLTCYDFTT